MKQFERSFFFRQLFPLSGGPFKDPWTPSDFLEGNLLENFVCNALVSLRNGCVWEVRLVTQAEGTRFPQTATELEKTDYLV